MFCLFSEYLSIVRECDGYGSIVFPHCCSDARKEGHVTPIVTFTGIIFGKSFLRKRFINYWVKGSKKMKPLTFEF